MKFLFNVDTLEVSFMIKDFNVNMSILSTELATKETNSIRTLLDRARDESFTKTDNEHVILENQIFEVFGHGNRFYYYLLHNNNLEIRLVYEHQASDSHFPVFVKFKSEYLWQFGYQQAYKDTKAYIEKVFGEILESRISRIDLACHVNKALDFNKDTETVCRAKSSNLRYDNSSITSYEFGKNPIMLRIYNKSKEIAVSNKYWFMKLWDEAGFDLDTEVWNIEYQLRRDFFKDRNISSVEDTFEVLKLTWNYLTAEWFRVVDDDSTRNERKSTKLWWQIVQCALDDAPIIGSLKKKSMLASNTDHLLKSVAGYLVSIAAIEEIDDLRELLSFVERRMVIKYAEQKNAFPDVVRERRELYCY